MAKLLTSEIVYFGQRAVLGCDSRCDKAWGVQCRPRFQREGADDFVFLADDEVGVAPRDPGTYEGDHSKPDTPTHNKWCARQCERSDIAATADGLRLPDLSRRRENLSEREGR